jgi:hypothetical protein
MADNTQGAAGNTAMLQAWRAFAMRLGFTDFVSPEDGFKRKEGDAWSNARSTGIYFWIAENGEAYVGQAKSVRRRLLQHWKVHRDIIEAAFQPVDGNDLNAAEDDLIKRAGKAYPTRNIKRALETAAYVPFDQFMSAPKRDSFLKGEQQGCPVDWRDLGVLEQKQAKRFQRLQHEPCYRQLLGCLRTYVEKCIPLPASTENRFWSVTLFPQAGTFLRVNAGQQEVFTVIDGDGRAILARPLALERMLYRSFDGPHYSTKSYAYFVPHEKFGTWLTPKRLVSCRKLVVRLMRHSTALNNGSHCPQIVRAAFGSLIPRG